MEAIEESRRKRGVREVEVRLPNGGSVRLGEGAFYILCPDNDVPHALDARRIQWAADDIIQNRPALSRWHKDHKDKFATYVKDVTP